VNIVSWNRAYCLFPWRTLVEQRSQLLRHNFPDESHKGAMEKYIARGWKFSSWDEMVQDDEMVQERRIGDQWTWTVGLNEPKSFPHLEERLRKYGEDIQRTVSDEDSVTRVRFTVGIFGIVLLRGASTTTS